MTENQKSNDNGELGIICEEIVEKLKLLDYENLFTRQK